VFVGKRERYKLLGICGCKLEDTSKGVCVCVCVRECVRVCICTCVVSSYTHADGRRVCMSFVRLGIWSIDGLLRRKWTIGFRKVRTVPVVGQGTLVKLPP
jgi:hypothetical protein